MPGEGAMPEVAMISTAEDPRCVEGPSEAEKPADKSSWIRQKKAWLLGLAILGLATVVMVMVAVCATILGPKNPPIKGYLAEYQKLPDHEVYRPEPSAVLNDTDLEHCAAKCSTNLEWECEHVQFCAREGTQRGTCHLFHANTRLRSYLSHSCDVYTRGDPAETGIPHGGASSLKTGVCGRLLWILSSLVVAVIFVA